MIPDATVKPAPDLIDRTELLAELRKAEYALMDRRLDCCGRGDQRNSLRLSHKSAGLMLAIDTVLAQPGGAK